MSTDDLIFEIRKTVPKDMDCAMEGQMRATLRPDILCLTQSVSWVWWHTLVTLALGR